MNIKTLTEILSHSAAFKYWLLLIPIKTTGSYALIRLVRIYLAKEAQKINYYLSNSSSYNIIQLSCSRPDKVFYLTYYLMLVGDIIN